jgi:dUTP pyrophosphatase
MQIKFKKLHPNAKIPAYSKIGDAGMDLTAISKNWSKSDGGYYCEYDTGLSVEIPEGYVGLIFPRSSQSNVNLLLTNHVGVIDSGFRGPIRFRFKKIIAGTASVDLKTYEVGDRVGQLIILPFPKIEPIEVDELSETTRGSGGFGSTGR